MKSFRKQLLLLSLLFATLLYGSIFWKQAPPWTRIPHDLQDLYWIFQHEIRTDSSRNVYQTLGNQLQLEGPSYTAVLAALNAYDLLLLTARLPLPEPRLQEEIEQALLHTPGDHDPTGSGNNPGWLRLDRRPSDGRNEPRAVLISPRICPHQSGVRKLPEPNRVHSGERLLPARLPRQFGELDPAGNLFQELRAEGKGWEDSDTEPALLPSAL